MWQKVYNITHNKYFLSLSGNVVMSGLGLVTMTMIYRSLSPAEAGTWVFFQSILLLIDSIRSGFLTTAFIKFYSGTTKERAAEVAGSAWFLGLCITGVLVLISLISFLFLDKVQDEGLMMFFKYSGLYYAISLPWYMGTCVIQGEQLFGKLMYIRLSNQASFAVFVLLLILTGNMSIIHILFAYLLSNLISSIYVMLNRWTRINAIKNCTRNTVTELFNFGKYSVGTSLSSNLFNTSDNFIINFMLGKKALAVYNLGKTLMQLIEIPLRSFAATAMPQLAKAYNQNSPGLVVRIMKKYAGMLTVILIPAVLIGCLLANLPIYIIGGGKYVGTEAANVFRLFLTFALIFPTDRFFALTLDIIHQPKINFYKVLIMLVVNIAADYVGIYITQNVYGIAIATVMPIMTGTFIAFWALNKYCRFTYFSVFKVGYMETRSLVQQAIGKRKLTTR